MEQSPEEKDRSQVYFLFNHFEKNIYSSWQEFQIKDQFCDVTLACMDQEIRAHKGILAKSSSVLGTILMQTSDKHPIIIFSGINISDLVNLVNFLYRGQIIFSQDKLDSFIRLANYLEIKGISENTKKKVRMTLKPLNSWNTETQNTINVKSPDIIELLKNEEHKPDPFQESKESVNLDIHGENETDILLALKEPEDDLNLSKDEKEKLLNCDVCLNDFDSLPMLKIHQYICK